MSDLHYGRGVGRRVIKGRECVIHSRSGCGGGRLHTEDANVSFNGKGEKISEEVIECCHTPVEDPVTILAEFWQTANEVTRPAPLCVTRDLFVALFSKRDTSQILTVPSSLS